MTMEELVDYETTLKDEIKLFYDDQPVEECVEKMHHKEEDRILAQRGLAAINLEAKSDDDVLELMVHREENMRVKALNIIHDRLRGPNAGTKQQQQELMNKIRLSPKSLVAALNTKNTKVLHKAIIVIFTVTNEDFKVKFPKNGGFGPLSNCLSLPSLAEEIEVVTHIFFVIITMVTIEENRDPFREASGVIRVAPFLRHTDPKIRLMATESLLNLCLTSEQNQVLLSKAGIIPTVFINALSTNDHQTKFENLFLLRHLVRCSVSKDMVEAIGQQKLNALLDPTKAYAAQDNTADAKNNLSIQKTVLEILYELTSTPRNQQILGEAGLVLTLESFFNSVKQGTNLKWNFDVLLRALKTTDNLMKYGSNREQFIETKGVALIDQFIMNHAAYPEDCLMEAASILTTIATNASENQSQFGKLGMQRMISLWKQFPSREFVQHLVANMISNVATVPRNREMVLAENGDKILMNFIKESRVKQVLVKSCHGVLQLCSEQRVVRALVNEKVVPFLVGLLQLNQPELQLNVASIVQHVAVASESGLIEIVRNGGIIPLINLLSDPKWEVRQQALLTLKKILFAPGQSGPQNVKLFFQAEGEKPLIRECLLSPSENVHLTALEIIYGLMKTSPEARSTMFKEGLEDNAKKCQLTVLTAGSKASEICKIILALIQKEIGVVTKSSSTTGARVRILWLKVICANKAKLFPLRDSLKFSEFVPAIRKEFNMSEWDRLSFRHGNDEIEVTDQRTLNYILSCLQREKDIFVEILPKPTGNARQNKIDLLLQRLTHRQLHILVKEAIDKEADLAGQIRQMILDQRKIKEGLPSVPERVNIEPLGSNDDFPDEEETKEESPLDAPDQKKANDGQDPNFVADMKRGGSSAPRGGPRGGPAPPRGGPVANLKTAKANAAAGKAGGGDLMSQLKRAVVGGGGLRRVELNDADKKKILGDKAGNAKGGTSLKYIGEGADVGHRVWEMNKQHGGKAGVEYANLLKSVLLMDYSMMQVIFKVLQKTIMPFPVLFELVKDNEKITQDSLAQALIQIGVTVTYALYTVTTGEGTEKQEESEPRREYVSALASYDIPVGIIYRTVSAVLHANYHKRIAGALPDDYNLKNVLEAKKGVKVQVNMAQYSSKSNQAKNFGVVTAEPEPVVAGFTQQERRGSGARQRGGDVVVGYTSKKKYNAPTVVKSLWDDEDTATAVTSLETQAQNEAVSVQQQAPSRNNYQAPEPVNNYNAPVNNYERPAPVQQAQPQPAQNDAAPVVAYSGRKKYQPAQVGSLW